MSSASRNQLYVTGLNLPKDLQLAGNEVPPNSNLQNYGLEFWLLVKSCVRR